MYKSVFKTSLSGGDVRGSSVSDLQVIVQLEFELRGRRVMAKMFKLAIKLLSIYIFYFCAVNMVLSISFIGIRCNKVEPTAILHEWHQLMPFIVLSQILLSAIFCDLSAISSWDCVISSRLPLIISLSVPCYTFVIVFFAVVTTRPVPSLHRQ